MSLLVELMDPTTEATKAACAEIFAAALDPETQDDRLESGLGSTCAVAFGPSGKPVGFCMGSVQESRLLPLDLVVVPGYESAAEPLWDLAASANPEVDAELWGRPIASFHEELASRLGFVQIRRLHQMRAALPVPAADNPLPTRAFRPGIDNDIWLEVNNASFAGHPEQGGWTNTKLESRMKQEWFNPEGFRLFFDSDILAGFCWTKVHKRPGLEDLGEIYVIGLMPSHHGRGLGVPMTAAGLAWLADNGLRTAMLYVEATNAPALAAYERIGFSVFATYCAWKSMKRETL